MKTIYVKKFLPKHWWHNNKRTAIDYQYRANCFCCETPVDDEYSSTIADIYINDKQIIFNFPTTPDAHWDYRIVFCSTSCLNVFKNIPQMEIFDEAPI